MQEQSNIESKSFSIVHHNVCSLFESFEQLYVVLVEFNIDFDSTGIAKSHISKTNFVLANITLENYTTE